MVIWAIGMDVHKDTCTARIVCGEYGKSSKRIDDFIESFDTKFRRFPSGASEFLEMARFMKGKDCHILIENSTKSHEVYWILRSLGFDVTVAHATDLNRITSSVKKTDRNDAYELASYMRRRLNGEIEFAESFIPSHDWMRRREICRYLADEKSELTVTKKQIRAYLLLHGMHTRREYKDITSKGAISELMGFKDTVLSLYLKRVEHLKARIGFTEKAIMSDFMNIPMFRTIYSMVGAGILTSAYLTSLIVDIGRFSSKKSFSASFGLTPKLRDSGGSEPECGITRRGDALARRLIHQMTFVHIRFEKDSFVTKKYHRLKARGKKHNEVLVACSNSLLHILYIMLFEDRGYISDPDVLKESRNKAEMLVESEDDVTEMDPLEDD